MILVDFTANDVAELWIAIKGVNSQDTLTETFPNYNVELHILGLIQFCNLKLMGKGPGASSSIHPDARTALYLQFGLDESRMLTSLGQCSKS